MINFLKFQKIYFLISSTIILFGLFSIFHWGFRYSIDFVGGTNLEYQFDKKVTTNEVKNILNKNGVEVVSISQKNNDISIRTKALDEKKTKTIQEDIENQLKTKITVLRSETVGPVLGRETMIKTSYAALLAILGILLYMTYAFKKFNFALAAIAALLHDILVLVGSYSLVSHFFGAELDTLFVTALLTTMSFSVHDTIIVFDKIREYMKVHGKGEMHAYANQALTETLVRSLNNSATIIFMLLALVLLGGSTIRFFAVALLIGTITGAYSSPFVATPIAVWLEQRKK